MTYEDDVKVHINNKAMADSQIKALRAIRLHVTEQIEAAEAVKKNAMQGIAIVKQRHVKPLNEWERAYLESLPVRNPKPAQTPAETPGKAKGTVTPKTTAKPSQTRRKPVLRVKTTPNKTATKRKT